MRGLTAVKRIFIMRLGNRELGMISENTVGLLQNPPLSGGRFLEALILLGKWDKFIVIQLSQSYEILRHFNYCAVITAPRTWAGGQQLRISLYYPAGRGDPNLRHLLFKRKFSSMLDLQRVHTGNLVFLYHQCIGTNAPAGSLSR